MMWSRKELKGNSKIRMHANYWKCILVALVLSFIAGAGAISSGGSGAAGTADFPEQEAFAYENTHALLTSPTDSLEAALENLDTFSEETQVRIGSIVLVIAFFAFVTLLVLGALFLLLRILVFNPLEIGCRRFYHKNLNVDASVKEICYSFDNSYKNGMKIMFFRDLYTFLWTLLFIIPGIVKSYEYRMIPYILGENPSMDKDAVFALSRKMMTGNKWNAFVLDLSFLGWEILSGLTLGILGIFYVNPYVHQTDAALYEAIKAQTIPEHFA